MTKQVSCYALRMKPELRAKVKASAAENERSVNGEICYHLNKAYAVPQKSKAPGA